MTELDQPPDNPEEWNDEQWLAWLSSTDGAAEFSEINEENDDGSNPWRISRTATGTALGNALLGLQYALQGRPDDRPPIVIEASGDHKDDEVEVHLDPDDPSASTVVIHRDAKRPSS